MTLTLTQEIEMLVAEAAADSEQPEDVVWYDVAEGVLLGWDDQDEAMEYGRVHGITRWFKWVHGPVGETRVLLPEVTDEARARIAARRAERGRIDRTDVYLARKVY